MAGFSGGVKNGNGKRERSDQEDDQEEFMPLSKRINNIHLSPERVLNGSTPHATFANPNIINHRPLSLDNLAITPNSVQINNVQVPDYHKHMGANARPPAPDAPNIHYRPSLNQHANPHYYEANRALFNLYIERQIRNHQDPHPNVFGRPPNGDGSNNL